jgi:hypothetical protein
VCNGLLVGGLIAAGECGAGAGEHVEAKVAAAFDPFVVLFGQRGSDETDGGAAAGEDADDVGAAPALLVEWFLGLVGPDSTPDLRGDGGEREQVVTRGVEGARPLWALCRSVRRAPDQTGPQQILRRVGRRWSAAGCVPTARRISG